jgi:hypothetical protein
MSVTIQDKPNNVVVEEEVIYVDIVGGKQGATGPTGPQGDVGDTGVEIGASAPDNTEVLWLDTEDQALASLARSVLSDFIGQYSYIGVATYGSSITDEKWRVTRIDIQTPVTSKVADLISWDNRLEAEYV